ncbi:MAG TPA: type VI secretion system tube protein TssD [Burkholderiaceae bacterium]
MPSTVRSDASLAGSDIFLHVQTKRAGKVKGEAVSPGHEDDIAIRAWHWGVTANSAIGSTQATARRSYRGLTVVKLIDSATTALMAALATNDEVKEAKLTMRKPGSEQVDYFLVTLNNARVSTIEHATDAEGNTLETVTLVFTKVEVEYRPQKSTGGRGGSFTFQDEVIPSA